MSVRVGVRVGVGVGVRVGVGVGVRVGVRVGVGVGVRVGVRVRVPALPKKVAIQPQNKASALGEAERYKSERAPPPPLAVLLNVEAYIAEKHVGS